MGFLVVTDVRLSGQQFDLIAEKQVAGGVQLRIAVECKYLSRGKVANQDVIDFKNVFNALRDSQQFTHGVLVTNADFSADAKAIAHGSNTIALKRLSQLEDEVLGLPASYFDFVLKYEDSKIYDTYIDLEAEGHFPIRPTKNANLSVVSENFSSIENAIMKWAISKEHGFLSILGDFGSGKTTLLHKIKYICCKKYLEGINLTKPIMLPLRDFAKAVDLDDFLLTCLRQELGREVSLNLIWDLIESGAALLLLDGFDEISTGTDRAARAQFFYDLAPLIRSQSKAIMTCRPAYFVSEEEYTQLLARVESDTFGVSPFYVMHESRRFAERLAVHDAVRRALHTRYLSRRRKALTSVPTGTVTLALLDDARIDKYLACHSDALRTAQKATWSEVKSFLLSIYDIRDLMSRPLLLDMVVEVVLDGRIDIHSPAANVGPSSLYENYTEMHFAIDWEKGQSRQFLTTEERRLFAQAVAWAMFRRESIEVSYEDIVLLVQENENVLERLKDKVTIHNLEEVVSDVQICAFLTRCGKHGFRFVHRSFMEFFAARYIKCIVEDGKRSDCFDELLPYEILYFLGGLRCSRIASWRSSTTASETRHTVGQTDSGEIW
jgi:hypothetical protein